MVRPFPEINEFELNTDRRAAEREELDERKHEQELLLEEMREERRRREEEQDKAAIAQLRHDMVHKAQPVKHYRPVTVQPSDKPLTAPQTPKFSDRLRK